MGIQQYVSDEAVKTVCQQLGIRDWAALDGPEVLPSEAEAIMRELGVAKIGIDVEGFRSGLQVELEHGKRFSDANVTNNHPVLTGLIVVAHLKESLDYYKFLEVAEIEGDMAKAAAAKDAAKIGELYRKLLAARFDLDQAILGRLS